MSSRAAADSPAFENPDSTGDVSERHIELSVVLPCLNEVETVGTCVRKAQQSMQSHGISGEVIVADNGSSDGSADAAEQAGARVISVEQQGYGAAIQGGVEAARGAYVVMADADDSYALDEVHAFFDSLNNGYDLVMGNRFQGEIETEAMPILHKYLGNPVLSLIGRIFYGSQVGDFHCGLRGFRKEAFESLDVRSTGMEFASELVVKAELAGLRIQEIPTTLSPDGRSGDPHLNTWKDGWRHLLFLLLYSPTWLFLVPGMTMMGAGLLFLLWLYIGEFTVGAVSFTGVHSMMYAALAIMIGFQTIWFGLFTKNFAVNEGLLPEDKTVEQLVELFSLEGGLAIGGLLATMGLGGAIYAIALWRDHAFGSLDPANTFEIVIPSFLAMAIGVQIIFSSFFLSVLQLKHR
jgi:glycosyltransferase involved in cell wall biosynthesis